MPRIAKRDYDTSFFHIMVQGIRKEYIFESEVDKEKYINILYKKLEKYNIHDNPIKAKVCNILDKYKYSLLRIQICQRRSNKRMYRKI